MPVADFLMKPVRKVGCARVCFGQGHLHVVEVANGAWNCEVHRAQFTNEVHQVLARHAALGGWNVEEGLEVRTALWGYL